MCAGGFYSGDQKRLGSAIAAVRAPTSGHRHSVRRCVFEEQRDGLSRNQISLEAKSPLDDQSLFPSPNFLARSWMYAHRLPAPAAFDVFGRCLGGSAVAHQMHTAPVPRIPMAWAAPRLRSRLTPDMNGPRSLTTTVTDFPVRGLVTVRRVPNGSVRWAAVMPWGSKTSPLAVRPPCP